MNWEDEGYLLSKNKFRENANIINIFTKNHGKISGIIYGGNSRKIKNFLQISNKLFVVFNAKNENQLGYFKPEIISPIAPKYFDDKLRSSCILSLTSLLNNLLPESQPNKKIYDSLDYLFIHLEEQFWIYKYIFWEYNLIKEIGFDVNLKSFKKNKNGLDFTSVVIDNTDYDIPNFMIENSVPKIIDHKIISSGLFFNRQLFLNKFYKENNIFFPKSRILFEKHFMKI